MPLMSVLSNHGTERAGTIHQKTWKTPNFNAPLAQQKF